MEYQWKKIGLVATDRNVETGKLIMSMLEQNRETKEIRINDDW